QNDASIRTALAENLKTRATEAKAIAARVKTAFRNYDPNQLSGEELARRNYLASSRDLEETQQAVIDKGLEVIRSSRAAPTITLHNTAALKALMKPHAGDDRSIVGTADLADVIGLIGARPSAGPLTVYSLCQAELDAENILNNAEGKVAVQND